ncbi:Vegetative cell wall protein gp1 precursor (Hydroxyproline-rich glycoprotein 1) [Minicystis rosea]|nr:Vegetative cell wall protein gp1 precursor (Hydroxyproline-rich glycoprotein 1) [Minicystis rosea]
MVLRYARRVATTLSMETLTSRIARRGALTPLDAVGWIVRLARSLERGHARGLIHKRVSPHCLLIEDSAPASAGRLVAPEEAPDLIAYHSPERVAGKEPAPADDAWGVAVTLYEALTGMAAYEGADDDAALAHLQDVRPVPLVAFGVDDAALQAILDRALMQDWMARINNLSALRRALEAWRPAARFGGLAPLDDPRLPGARGSATIPPGVLADFRSVAPPPPSTDFRSVAPPPSSTLEPAHEERAALPLDEAPSDWDADAETSILRADRFPLLSIFERPPASAPTRAAEPEPARAEPTHAAEIEPARAAEPAPASAPTQAAEQAPASAPTQAAEPAPVSVAAHAAEPEPASAPAHAAEPEPALASARKPEHAHETPTIVAPPPARGGSRTMMMVAGAVVLGGIAATAALRSKPSSADATPAATAIEVRTTPPPPSPTSSPVTTAMATATAATTATATAAVAAAPVDLKACVRQVYPADTFTTGTTPDFAYLCEETDPRRGATRTKTKLVVGSGGHLSEAMRESALMGWYQMASFAVIRARCCSAPPPLQLPEMPGPCPRMEQQLNELGAAAVTATDMKDAKLKAAVDGYTDAIHCLVRSNSTGNFEWHDNPHGGEDTAFLNALGRVVAAKR